MTSSAPKLPDLVRNFLGEFALAVHRYLIYPPDHPLLEENAQRVADLLNPRLTGEEPLDLIIAGSRIVVAGRIDEEAPTHHELATKLRDLGIGAIRMDPSSGVQDVQALLSFLKQRSAEGQATLEPGTPIQGTSLIEVRPFNLSGLEISWDDTADEGSDRLVQLWTALDRETCGTVPSNEQGRSSDDRPDRQIERIADGLRSSVESPAGSARAVGVLRQLLGAAGGPAGAGTQVKLVRKRLSGLIAALDPDTIRELAGASGPTADQASFVADMSVLGDEAVARVLKAVANPTARSLTDSLGRLFGKMARQGVDSGGSLRSETQQALRRSLLELMKEWALDDPNPTEYGSALDRISQKLQGLGARWELGTGNEPERILQMSLELSTHGPVVERAAEHLLFQTEGGLTKLVNLIEGEDPSSPAVVAIATLLEDPDRIRSLVDAEDIDDATLNAVVQRMGEGAITPLLEVLARSQSRSVRTKVFQSLVGIGAPAAEGALRSLPDERWYVTRNLLLLARKAGYHFPWFDPDPYLESPEPLVRREAYKLAYLDPKRRTKALVRALEDSEDRLVQEALAELESGVPSVVASALSNWVTDETFTDKVRLTVIEALAHSRAPIVLSALLSASSYRSRVLRRRRLRKTDEVARAALWVLASRWGQNPEAREVLTLARKAGVVPTPPTSESGQ